MCSCGVCKLQQASQSDTGIDEQYLQTGVDNQNSQSIPSPPYQLPESSLVVEGAVESPVLLTSSAGLRPEDAGIYSCVVLDNNLMVQLNSSIEISVLRKLSMIGNVVFATDWLPVHSPRRRGVYGLYQDICTW